ncbi:YmfL family putative regulatory protein [Caballeronia sp. LZ001]|uniref:YmfL family putative regulatory protein n=1 Tax=Caballeronia sp. LZ001 TaxID=3038553 RepID=UPI002861A476|nr:YmfL family putative regulatory protein [Caballeronia sp. LZ001]MDR5801174.1 YmfL family putative regulatory protein [Caballeronia sp. LZ001]
MNTADAAYAVAHEYPGGCEALAPRLGMSGALLRNKVNTNRTPENRNVLNLADAVRMTDLTDDERILEAWLAQRNAVMVKLPDACEEPDNEEIVDKFMSLTVHYGQLAKRFREATADGEVDDQEMADLERIGGLIHRAVEEINMLTKRIYRREPQSAAAALVKKVS